MSESNLGASLPSLGATLPTLGTPTGQAASGSGQPQVVPVTTQLQADAGLGQAMLDILDQIVAHTLTQQPVDSQGNPTATTVYLQYQTGVGIDPRQYANPWTPMGGSSLQTELQSGQQATPTPAPAPTAPTPGGASTPPAPVVDTALQASLLAAWETSMLADQMFLVDNTGQMQYYQSGSRSLAFAYGEILNGMQPSNPAPPSAKVQADVQAAQEVIWQTDNEGNFIAPTILYQNYLNNQMAWAQAKSNLAAAQAEAMTNPALGQVWPQMSATYQTAVDQAYSTWIAEGAEQVEQALATIESEGMDVVDAMVAQARQLFSAWSLSGLSGVPAVTEYSMVSPISWYDPTDNSIGFTGISTTSESAAADSSQHQNAFSSAWYQGQSQSTSASASGSFFGISLGASGGSSSQSGNTAQGGDTQTTTFSADQTSEVSISLEWLLCQVQRPWLVSDLFHVDGWYMVGQKKNTISDGTVTGQIDNQTQLLPMIPTSFLVVRNVTIQASNWGQAADSLAAAQTAAQSAEESSSWDFGGSVGFFGIGASAAHSSSQDSGESTADSSGQLSWSWSGDRQTGTLTINGAQILGWIGAIVPACPPIDDPTLKSQSTSGTQGSSSGGAQPTPAPSQSSGQASPTPAPSQSSGQASPTPPPMGQPPAQPMPTSAPTSQSAPPSQTGSQTSTPSGSS